MSLSTGTTTNATFSTTTDSTGSTIGSVVIIIITCAVIGLILALVGLIICISSKCAEMEESKRKAEAVEVSYLLADVEVSIVVEVS